MKNLLIILFITLFFSCKNEDKIYPYNNEEYKFGYLNSKGDIIVEPQFDFAYPLINNFAVVKKNGKYGFINEKGKLVIDFRFEGAESFAPNGLGQIKMNGKWGYINNKGIITIRPQFSRSSLFGFEKNNSFAEIVENGYGGVINEKGEVIIKPEKNQFLFGFFNNDYEYIDIKKNGKVGYLDNKGNLVIDYIFDDGKRFYIGNEISAVKIEKKWAIIDKNGDFIVKPKFDEADVFYRNNNLIKVKNNNDWNIIKKDGTKLLDKDVDKIKDLYNKNLIGIKIKDKWGIINNEGNYIVSTIYEEIKYFYKEENYIKVRLNNKWGVINKKGQEVIPTKYEKINSYSKGYFTFESEGKEGVLDKKNNIIISPTYNGIYFSGSEKLFEIHNNKSDVNRYCLEDDVFSKCNSKRPKERGFINLNGNIVIDPIFDNTTSFDNNNLARVSFGKRIGYINTNGKTLGFSYGDVHNELKGVPYGKQIKTTHNNSATSSKKRIESNNSNSSKNVVKENIFSVTIENAGFLVDVEIPEYTVVIQRTSDLNGKYVYNTERKKTHTSGFFGSDAAFYNAPYGFYTVEYYGYDKYNKKVFHKKYEGVEHKCHTIGTFYTDNNRSPYLHCF